jgi:heme-degrading monooxygenase HmoA
MAKMIVNHKVEDFKNWKSAFDSMHALRKQFGCTGEKIFQSHSNPNEILIVTEWGSNEQAHQYGESKELIEGMKKAGVVTKPEIYFSEEVGV